MKCVNRCGRDAGSIRRLVHRAARLGPVRIRAAAIVGKAFDFGSQSELSPVFVELAEIYVEASVLLRQEDNVVDRGYVSRRASGSDLYGSLRGRRGPLSSGSGENKRGCPRVVQRHHCRSLARTDWQGFPIL